MKANWKFIHIRRRPKQQPDKFQTIRGKVFVHNSIALFSLTLCISLIGVHLLLYPLMLHMLYCRWCWTISERIQVLRYSHRSLIGFASAFSVVSSFHRLYPLRFGSSSSEFHFGANGEWVTDSNRIYVKVTQLPWLDSSRVELLFSSSSHSHCSCRLICGIYSHSIITWNPVNHSIERDEMWFTQSF